MLHAQLAALALAAITLAASGCGGSSKTSSTTTTTTAATPPATTVTTTTPPATATPVKVATGRPLTRSQFVAKAEAICARTNTKLSAVTVITTKEFARVLPQIVLYDSAESSELSKLVPPTGMTHDWAQILGDFRLYGEYTSTAAKYAQANNLKAMAPLIHTAEELHKKLAALVTRKGLKHCSRFS